MVTLVGVGELIQITTCIAIILTLIIYDGFITKQLNNPAIKTWSLYVASQLFIAICGLLLAEGVSDHIITFTTQQIIYALRGPFLLALFFVYYHIGIHHDFHTFYSPSTYKTYVKLICLNLIVFALCKGFQTEMFTLIMSMFFDCSLLVLQQIGLLLVYKHYDLGNVHLWSKHSCMYRLGMFAMYALLFWYMCSVIYFIFFHMESAYFLFDSVYFALTLNMSVLLLVYTFIVKKIGQLLLLKSMPPAPLQHEESMNIIS